MTVYVVAPRCPICGEDIEFTVNGWQHVLPNGFLWQFYTPHLPLPPVAA